MANELTNQARSRIGSILSSNAFYNYNAQETKGKEDEAQTPCARCGCTGGNGSVLINGVYVPCSACTNFR